MNTLIKGLKAIVSLYEYCETNGLIYAEDAELFCNDEEGEIEQDVDKDLLDGIFVELWERKLSHEIKQFKNAKWDNSLKRVIIELPNNGTFAIECWFDDNLCFGSHDTISIKYDESNGRNLAEQISDVLQIKLKSNDGQEAKFEIEIGREHTFDKLLDVIGKLSNIVNMVKQKYIMKREELRILADRIRKNYPQDYRIKGFKIGAEELDRYADQIEDDLDMYANDGSYEEELDVLFDIKEAFEEVDNFEY